MFGLRTRTLATTARILNRGTSIDRIILDQLKDSSKLNKPSSFLILPSDHANMRMRDPRKRVINTKPQHPPQLKLASILLTDDIEEESTSSVIKLINNLRIYQNKVSDHSYKSVTSVLTKSFTSAQLKEYIRSYTSDPDYKGRKEGIAKKTKRQLCRIIISDLWNIQRSGKETSVEDFLTSRHVELQKKDLFLLLLNNGLLIRYLSRTGCKITFKNNTMSLRGTETQVSNANIILDYILVSSYQQTLDLSTIKRLFVQKFGDFDLNKLSSLFQIYFEELDNDHYRLSSLNQTQTQRAQRMLLWFLDYNSHIKQFVKIPSVYETKEFECLPFKEDESINWFNRLKSLFRLSSSPKNIFSSGFIDSQLKVFDDESLLNKTIDFEELNQVKSFLTPPEVNPQNSQPEAETDPLLNDSEISDLYNQLSQFPEDNHVVSKTQLVPPIFVITLGNVLFESTSKTTHRIPSADQDSLSSDKYIFNPSIPLLHDKVSTLPLFGNPELSLSDINEMRINDPHEYLVQLKFQPSLYDNESTDAPPVEVWINLNRFGKPEMNTLRVFTVENENTCFMPLPDKASDMKISSQLIGDVLKAPEAELEETSPDATEQTIESLLNETSEKYTKLKGQPGLETFLERSRLDFSGKVKPHIHETLRLQLSGKTVNYQYISTNYRRDLEFVYHGKLLQFSSIEGGSLGGRSSEVVLVGHDFDRDSLKELIEDSVAFINQL
ncbi:mitochondrial protein regulator [Yamadazyma tenuis]|uniref:Uncharacterized protein n=1 Tax=Candida tenuis (strain ATCC 10573 / BCRC 21748 / CBS 615 / JCM 9827 / NBRC 10315 / NRRL Y-1498 / VKM Y-70) TaxID=590646 RepID=G3BCL3_CANTC|nr:uncharacterized protein CANTEDRAFT_95650 [Yamadazyma tenuis ATCC 10573]EGV60193.1 hypothetical protein CANTEDRAFT_95650 [Yamadazyma tenuis ATCC 10573]WEJ94571.1 mitochondrial protein regulator [Yamadazyma tenuis]